MRDVVKNFAEEMKKILAKNDEKGDWNSETFSYLFQRLYTKVDELDEELDDADDYGLWIKRSQKKCIDIANFAMMIWDNLDMLQVERELHERDTKIKRTSLREMVKHGKKVREGVYKDE